MYTIKVLTHGMNVGSNQARLGLSSVILLQGEQNILVDVKSRKFPRVQRKI